MNSLSANTQKHRAQKYRAKTFTFIAMLLSLLTTESIAMYPEPTNLNGIQLHLAATATAAGTLLITVKVQNTTPKDLQLTISDQDPPIDLSIFDQNGNDIYQPHDAPILKSGKSADPSRRHINIVLDLRRREAKEYSWTVAKIPGADNTSLSIPPGRYVLQARLASLNFSGNDYTVTVHRSNLITVLIAEK